MRNKLYTPQMELVSRQWSGTHKRVVKGINLTTRLWSDGDKHIPCDYRLYKNCVSPELVNYSGVQAKRFIREYYSAGQIA